MADPIRINFLSSHWHKLGRVAQSLILSMQPIAPRTVDFPPEVKP